MGIVPSEGFSICSIFSVVFHHLYKYLHSEQALRHNMHVEVGISSGILTLQN